MLHFAQGSKIFLINEREEEIHSLTREELPRFTGSLSVLDGESFLMSTKFMAVTLTFL